MSIAFDAPFIGLFLLTTIAVVGLFAMGIFRLIQFRDPEPVKAPSSE